MNAAPDFGPGLLPQHAAYLAARAVAPQVVTERGYRSVTTKAELKRLGFTSNQCSTPGLLLPIHGVGGDVATYTYRPDQPRIRRGKPVKFEFPTGSRMVLDVPRRVRARLADPAVPLFITEGAPKADAAAGAGLACIAVIGVWNWRGTNGLGGKAALPDWESIALRARDDTARLVYLVFDSDVMIKKEVAVALARLKPFLESRGARVRVVYLPSQPDGSKQGLDDFLASGHTVDDLLSFASDGLRQPAAADDEPAIPYRSTPGGLVRIKQERAGDGVIETEVALTNFQATIIGDVAEDDGSGEVRRAFEVEGVLNGRMSRFTIRADRFESMGWASEHLGVRAIVRPGQRDHAQTAIRELSADVAERRVYTVTGWSELADGWGYLHGGGAIGPIGPIPEIEVRLPAALGRYTLPDPPVGDELVAAVRASARLLDVAPDPVTMPQYAAVWRAVLGTADFGLHTAGPTGAGKSELATLMLQHFGAGLDARHLPGSWSSTGNALEGLAFAARHTLLVIDDFAPNGSTADVQRYHREFDRVIRAQGNNAGRLRMQADATLRAAKFPRGTVLSTGEDHPRGQPVRARVLILEVEPDAVDWKRLTACQRDAAAGLYAQAMTGFVCWLAPRYAAVRDGLPAEVAALRQAAAVTAAHRRTPEIVANLAVGLRYFLGFAVDVGAFSPEGAARLWETAWAALGRAAAAQAAHQAASEPARRRFLDLLGAAIASERAHVAGHDGEEPEQTQTWGWRFRTFGTGENARSEWQPLGERVGWVTAEGLFLEPVASFKAAQQVGTATGDPLAVGEKTLHKRLAEQGLLVSTEAARGKLAVRRTLGGLRRTVLHLAGDALTAQESAQSAQSAQSAHSRWRLSGRMSTMGRFCGPIGPIGPIPGTQGVNGTNGHTDPAQAEPAGSRAETEERWW